MWFALCGAQSGDVGMRALYARYLDRHLASQHFARGLPMSACRSGCRPPSCRPGSADRAQGHMKKNCYKWLEEQGKSNSQPKNSSQQKNKGKGGKLSSLSQVESLGGRRYFLTFIDDASRKVWVYFLNTKDQMFEYFKSFHVMVERETGKKLKYLPSDNGGEYTSKEFNAYI
ncbi:Unknown protein [Striga hermonthica]|uniref:Integrase catalytic domain-containing protein n=1 Tax=Striga hermonthica TaxID=68872 RepID=A0A9N7MJC9_STRHE|nr:Unknown protein [Striga hermonthica]